MLVVVTFPVSHTMLRTAVAAGLRGGSVRMSATATQTRSALLEQTGLPKFDEIETPSVKPAVQDVLANLETDFASLESKLDAMEAPTYADVMEELEKVEAPIEYTWGVVGHLMGVKNSDELREAHSEMQPAVVQTTQKLSQSKAIYSAVEAISAGGDGALDEAQQRIVASSLQVSPSPTPNPSPYPNLTLTLTCTLPVAPDPNPNPNPNPDPIPNPNPILHPDPNPGLLAAVDAAVGRRSGGRGEGAVQREPDEAGRALDRLLEQPARRHQGLFDAHHRPRAG